MFAAWLAGHCGIYLIGNRSQDSLEINLARSLCRISTSILALEMEFHAAMLGS